MRSDPERVEAFAVGFDPFRVACDGDSDPVALPPAIKFVRCANESQKERSRAAKKAAKRRKKTSKKR